VFKNKCESESWASAPRTSVDVRISVALAFMTLVFKNKRESESWASAPRTSVDVRVSVALAFMTDAVVLAPEGHKRASECFFS